MTPQYTINIIIDTKKPIPKKALLRDAAEKVLELEGIRKRVSINLLFTDNKRIKLLNRQFLHRSHATDVISFNSDRRGFLILKDRPSHPLGKGLTPPEIASLRGGTGKSRLSKGAMGIAGQPPAPARDGCTKGFIGEVAISVEMAQDNARRFNTSEENEIVLYIIHGVLHLLGYGDKTEKGKRIIENRQTKILGALCAS